jgi:histidine triad (HIT) family protein
MHDCIFCAIVSKAIPSTIIFESPTMVVIADRTPQAPIHWLLIPKTHIPDITHVNEAHKSLAVDFFITAQKLAHLKPEAASFRLVVNTGTQAGQSVFHAHMHFLAGKSLAQLG